VRRREKRSVLPVRQVPRPSPTPEEGRVRIIAGGLAFSGVIDETGRRS
jgi:hypothetical protein